MPVGRPISLTPNIATKTLSATATADQTSFTVTGGYRINELGVYRNGVRLVQGKDFTASDGSTVTLLSGAVVDDTIDFVIFDSFNIADAINSVGNQTIDGELTATKFIGDGGELTGVGTANVVTNSLVSSGIVSITNTTDSTSSTTGSVIISGGVGIAKSLFVGNNVTIGGTLTYEDVSNIDSVGLITAQTGVKVTGGEIAVGAAFSVGQAGVATAAGFVGPLTGAVTGTASGNAVLTGSTDNTLVTVTGANAISGESNLKFNGTRLDVDSTAQNLLQLNSTNSDGPNVPFQRDGSSLGNVGSAAAITGGTATAFAVGAATTLVFGSNGSNERARIDSSGRLLVGIPTARANFNAGDGSQIQLEGTTQNTATISAVRSSNNDGPAHLVLGKSRYGGVGGNTVVQSGDNIGSLNFEANDGTNLIRAAEVLSQVDGTPGTNDMPGRLIFKTTADGAASATERMRITKTGAISLDNGELIERCYVQSSPAWSANGAVNLDNGVVQYNTTNYGSGGAGSLYFTSSVGINTMMSNGDIMSLTMITNVNSTAGYINNIFIDGAAATESWVGGSAPTAGGSSGVDIYTFNIIKTASATYTVIANQVLTSA